MYNYGRVYKSKEPEVEKVVELTNEEKFEEAKSKLKEDKVDEIAQIPYGVGYKEYERQKRAINSRYEILNIQATI